MTDMMFLLLVFFIVLTTLISPNALKLVLPQSNSQVKDKAYTTVSITPDRHFYLEMAPIPFSQLEKALQDKLKDQEKPVISLHADKSVPIEDMVKVMNIAIRNNYQLILAANPE